MPLTFFGKFVNMHIALDELRLREFPLPGQLSPPEIFSRVRVSQSSVSVFALLSIALSVRLPFAASDYPFNFGIFKVFLPDQY